MMVQFPTASVRSYRESGLWGNQTIAQEFHAIAQRHPDRTALVSVDLVVTFEQLDAMTDGVAVGLRTLGLVTGERVLLQIENSGWAVVAWYGLLKAGLVPVAALPQHRRHEIDALTMQAQPAAHLVQANHRGADLLALAASTPRDSERSVVLLTLGAAEATTGSVRIEDLAAKPARFGAARKAVDVIQAAIDPDDLAVLQLSGGTTNTPKLIPRLHAEYWYNSASYARAIGLNTDGCVLHLQPVIHNAGIVCGLHAAHAVGAAFAVARYDANEVTTVVARAGVTHMLLPPSLAQLIETTPGLRDQLDELRAVIWVLGPLTDQILRSYETDSCRVLQMFGMGEGLCMVTPPEAAAAVRHTTVGTPISLLDEVRVLDPESGEEVFAGEPGELCCRGPYTIRGYWNSPERNAEAFTSEGFYRTGDIVAAVQIDGRTYYRLAGRIKDVINRGGEKVNVAEVEELLCMHAAVDRAAIVAMPDRRLGERACAFVVARPDCAAPTLLDLQKHLDALGVAKFKWPERLEVRPALPLTNVHKVNKVGLRADIAIILEREARDAEEDYQS